MTDKILKTISKHNMMPLGCTVGVGLSGGADSVVLLHFLVTNKDILGVSSITAIHIHHGIRGEEADRDLEFSRSFCEKLGVEFACHYVDVPAEAEKTGESIEECARKIRYDIFSKSGCTRIATAHNLNDNMETVVFNLARGTSILGLCGIPYVRDCYIRPLLDCSRDEIEAYIQENSLEYVTDSTNLCDDYTRNKIRHNIIPQLFEINPNFARSFANCNDSVRLASNYIMQSAMKVVDSSRLQDENNYDCRIIDSCDAAVKNQAIALILKEQGISNITKKYIDALAHVIKSGGKVSLGGCNTATSDCHFLNFKEIEGLEYFEIQIKDNENSSKTPAGVVKLDYFLKENLQILDKSEIQNTIDCDKIYGKLVIRNRLEGDCYQPLKRVNKKLKKLFTENNIPIFNRSKMIIISDDKGIVWTQYFGVADRCKIDENTVNIIMVSVREE